jgi:hypothetical protein
MNTQRRRRERGEFLRTRRESLHPEDVGLSGGELWRAAVLRREEVAALSSVSLCRYTWLGQGRDGTASRSVALHCCAMTQTIPAALRFVVLWPVFTV